MPRRAADTQSRRPPLRRRLRARPEVDGERRKEQTPRSAARPSANVSGPGRKTVVGGAASESAAKGRGHWFELKPVTTVSQIRVTKP